MKLFAIISVYYLSMFAHAEVVTEFDGVKWKSSETKSSVGDIDLQEHRFVADSKTKMKQAIPLMSKLQHFQPYPVFLALPGEKAKGGRIRPLPEDANPSDLLIVVTCDPRGIDVGCIRKTETIEKGEIFETGQMSADHEGVEKFSAVVKSGIERASAENEPAMVCLNVRSETSWGQLVRMLALLNSLGCDYGIIRIDDQFEGLHVKVKQDEGTPPAKSPEDQAIDDNSLAIPSAQQGKKDKSVRIVVNVLDDGKLRAENGTLLDTDEQIRTYVKAAQEKARNQGRLFLRGADLAVKKYSQRVVEIAKTMGITDVVYATYGEPKTANPDSQTKPSNP